MNGLVRVAVIAAGLFSCGGVAACAEPLDVTLSVTLNALDGKHEIDGGHSDKLPFVPLPLGELTLRRGTESLRLEGLPPVTFGYDTAGDGALSTRLSLLNATYRHGLGGGWFVGVGQTVYNQYTTYAPVNGNAFYARGFTALAIDGSEAQYSRVTGPRFEAGRALRLNRHRVDVWAAVNPRMHGIQYTRIPTFQTVCSFTSGQANCAQRVATFADPESASQIDLSARVAHPVSKRGELLYGLRYLNYSAHYDDFPGKLADRNVGFAPVIGYRAKL